MPLGKKIAVLERVDARDRRAARARHLILEAPGVLAGLEHELRGAHDRLRSERHRDGAREPDLHAAVRERLDGEEHERGAGAGESGHGVEEVLVHDVRDADRLEEPLRLAEVRVGRVRAASERGRARADERGRVRHGADDAHAGAELAGDRVDRDARGDRDDELAVVDRGRDLVEEVFHRLRLHGEHDDVRLLRGLEVRGERRDAVPLCELLAAIQARLGADDVRLRGDPGAQEALHERLGHVPRAEEGDLLPEWHGASLALRGAERSLPGAADIGAAPRVRVSR